jgi:purine-binding chemotaxis protein CheW
MSDLTQSQTDTHLTQLITVYLDDQLFGIPVEHVRDIFKPTRVSQVPLACKEISGVVNLRGRIVTALNLREKLCMGPPHHEKKSSMMVAVEYEGEIYSLVVDGVGEVLTLPEKEFEKNPATLDSRLKELSKGIFKLRENLLVVLDIKKILNISMVGIGGEAA